MTSFEITFACPLPNGLHARPATQFAEAAGQFTAEVTLTNLRSGAMANAGSILGLISLDIRHGDTCLLRISGANAATAHAELQRFVVEILPTFDAPLPAVAAGSAGRLPPALRNEPVRWVAGTAACTGIGHGTVVHLGGLALPTAMDGRLIGLPAEELEALERARDTVLRELRRRIADGATPVEAGILGAHLAILDDRALREEMAARVAAGATAEQAVVEAGRFFASRLRAAESAFVRERALDVEDVCIRLVDVLCGGRLRSLLPTLTGPTILVADHMTPRQFLDLNSRWLCGLVLEQPGLTSHAVILARSRNLPTLVGASGARAMLKEGVAAIVDGDAGVALEAAAESTKRYYERVSRAHQRRHATLRAATGVARTKDGRSLEIAANVGSAAEVGDAVELSADGVGLFRTEMLFLGQDHPPSEAVQLAEYLAAVRAAAGRPVVFRTFDVGGDKPVPYLNLPREANPFLGYRGVRIYPEFEGLLREQLRALLRAAVAGPVWIMVPMITTAEELGWVRGVFNGVQDELAAGGWRPGEPIRLGVMIETPAATFQIESLAAEADFFSIGTNDLAQYFLAVEREGGRVSSLCNVRHPAFLRLLARTAREARRCGRWLGMCGEMAGHVANLPLLVGLELDEISVSAAQIAPLKWALAQHSAADARGLLERALKCDTSAEVDDLLAREASAGDAEEELLEERHVFLDADLSGKEDAIGCLVSELFASGVTDDRIALEEAIWAREAIYSTGLGYGFAIPHCKSDAVRSGVITLARLRTPIAWGAADDEPVRCVILLAMRASDAANTHMRVFAKLARKLMHEDFRARLLAADRPAAIVEFMASELELRDARGESPPGPEGS